MASEALTSLLGGRRVEPLGNRTSTRPSQNAIRNRKNMTPASPAAAIAARVLTLLGRLEKRVGNAETFLPIIEQNTSQIFVKFKKILFT
jgi:hypothetical protein